MSVSYEGLTVVAITSVVDLLPVCNWREGDVYIVDDKRYVWTGRKWVYLEELPEEGDGESDEQQ